MQDNSNNQWGNFALLRLGAFGFGITGFFMALDAVILPVLVLGLVPEGAKNTFLGLLGLSGLVVAALVQPVVGWYSDRTRSPLGRRVPYMLWGCISVSLGLVGLAAAMVSFAEASELMRELAGVPVDPKQVERVAKALGREIAQDERRVVEAEPPMAPTLYLGLDGTGVPMRASEVEGRNGKQLMARRRPSRRAPVVLDFRPPRVTG